MLKNTQKMLSYILPSLKECDLVNEDENEEELFSVLCGSTIKRLPILQWIISQFSEDYKKDLENAPSLESELSRKMVELQILDNSKKLSFVQGVCPAAEQKIVWEEIFKLLDLILFKKGTGEACLVETMYSTEPTSKEHIKKTKNKQNKHFDCNHAKNTLEEAMKLLEQNKLLQHEISENEDVCFKKTQKESVSSLTNTDLENCYSASSLFNELHSKWIPLPRTNTEDKSSDKIGSLVENLNKILHFVSKVSKESSTNEMEYTKNVDVKKTLEDMKEWKSNSHVFKLNNKCFDVKNDFIGTQ